jgi:hypothetical protein
MSQSSTRLSWKLGLQGVAIATLAGAAALAGCGGGSNSNPGGGGDPDGGSLDAGPSVRADASDSGNLIGNTPTVKAISIAPLQAAITSTNGAAVKQPYTLQVQYTDGTTGTLGAGVTWGSDAPLVGAIDGTGDFTANGSLGAVVHVSAAYKNLTASATLTVKLLLQTNVPNVPPSAQGPLQGASNKDASVVWAYPYDGTVWPRGLLPPILQWNGGAATDDYYVHIVSPTFELQQFSVAAMAPSSQLPIDAATWSKLTESTSGATKVTVARWDGTAATQITAQTWTISPASMRGTIYYWSNNLGRVLRIKPGAAAPDDFSTGTFGSLPSAGCTMTCHTVSADGSTLISGGDTLGGSYDLTTNAPIYDNGGAPGSAQKRLWSNAALSSNGKYVVENGNTSVPGPPGAQDGMWNSADGTRVAGSGLDGLNLGSPSFSADGTQLAYVALTGTSPGSLNLFAFNQSAGKVGASTMLVPQGTGQPIQWPSVSPDANWVVYHRGVLDTRTGNADLYLASATTPNQEIRLAAVDGDGYPFAAGSRDLSWNFEPTFAPVPSGGYFWVVFTSRRTYGNILTGPAEGAAGTAVKQLWVAAIDQMPKPGVDPSHAAFHLEGQDESNLAMRGFWSLPPCAQNGGTCQSGTDCCGGYCAGGADGGAPVCQSMPSGCSQNGDKCNATSDCCNAASGVTCIAHVCSEPTPQ